MATSDIVKSNAQGWLIKLPLAPVPAARVKVSRYGNYYPKTYETWRRSAHELLRPYRTSKTFGGPVKVVMDIACRRPKTPSNPYPRGDIDNYEKAVYDAITRSQCVWKDDVQITAVDVTKRYAEPGEAPHTAVRIIRGE